MAIRSKEYYAEIEKVYKKPEDYELAGKENAYVRIDAEAKVTGKAVYTDDVQLPGMWYCKLVRSPYASARIKNIDFSEAMKVEGVKAFLTGKDFPEGHNMGCPEAFKEMADKEPLCREIVRHVGDEVAAVCAVSEWAAEEGARRVKVEYEVLEPVLDVFEAMKPEAPAVHYPGTNNVSMYSVMNNGDADKVFAEADYTDKYYYRTQEIVHAALEPHGSVAEYVNGQYTVWTTTQNAYVARYWIAWGLGVPESAVRVIKPLVGGGFGGKVDVFAHDVCPARFAEKTGHPVKCILKRDEVFIGTRVRHPISFEIQTAFTKEGRLLAKRAKHVLNGGAYAGSGNAANALSITLANLPYRFDTMDFKAQRIYTNKVGSGAMRGYSACQVDFAHETHMDEVAENLHIDPLELRRMNGAYEGYKSPTGIEVTSCAFDETLVKCCEAVGWDKRNELPKGEGIGLAGSSFVSGTGFPILITPHFSSNSTLVRLNREGYATVFTGANDIGQGSDTVMTMIVAEELGLSMNEVKCVQSDTTLTPWDSGSYGSRVTFLAGNACRRAVGDAKLKLFKHLASEWDCRPEDITMKDHRVYLSGDPEKNISYSEAVFSYEEKNFGRCCDGVGSFCHENADQNIQKSNHGNYAPAYSFSSCTAKVKVDMETGELDMEELWFAHDCGRPLNLRAVEGQIEGSVLLGVGFSCYEECLYTPDGKHRNATFRDYRFPTALDMPQVRTIICGKPDPNGPLGAKEAGEGTTAPVGPAIANAIHAATGLRFHALPIDPERIWKALKENEKTGKTEFGDEGLAEKFAAMPELKAWE